MTEGHRTLHNIDEALASLPGEFAVASNGDARLVAGSAGAFVMVGVGGDTSPTEAAFLVSQLAADTRSALADHLSWVPFIDTMLVSLSLDQSRVASSTVPLDMVHVTVCEGRQVVDDRALGVIRDLLRRGMLGNWLVGLVPSGDRIDLCEPTVVTPQTT